MHASCDQTVGPGQRRLSSRQGEGHQGIRVSIVVFVAASRSDDDILLVRFLREESHGCGVCASRYANRPQLFSRVLIKSPEAAIISGADANEATGRNNRSSNVGCAGRRKMLLQQRIYYAQHSTPAKLSRVQIDGGQMAPWRFLTRQPVRIPKAR